MNVREQEAEITINDYEDIGSLIQAELLLISWQRALAVYETKRSIPPRRKVFLREPHQWHKFCAWKYIHRVLLPASPNVLRTQVYFRSIREVTTSANLKKDGSNVVNLAG